MEYIKRGSEKKRNALKLNLVTYIFVGRQNRINRYSNTYIRRSRNLIQIFDGIRIIPNIERHNNDVSLVYLLFLLLMMMYQLTVALVVVAIDYLLMTELVALMLYNIFVTLMMNYAFDFHRQLENSMSFAWSMLIYNSFQNNTEQKEEVVLFFLLLFIIQKQKKKQRKVK